MSYTERTIKILYGRSYNECNHPDCNQLIIEVDHNTNRIVNHGKIAHIRARNPGGQRWDENYPGELMHGEENLILLCARHHDIIDQDGAEDFYTGELLERWKAEHYQKKEITEDREWVYGASTLLFTVEGIQHKLDYWQDKNGNIRFFTPNQLEQANAASDLAMLFAQLNSLLTSIKDAEGDPVDPSRISKNDGYVRMFKQVVEGLKRGGFESGLERLYRDLAACPKITLAELALVGSTEKIPSKTIIVGEATAERISEALRYRKD